MSTQTSRRVTVVSLTLCAALACSLLQTACIDLLTAGFPREEMISAGDTISGSLSGGDDIDFYMIELDDTTLVAAFLRKVGDDAGTATLTVKRRDRQGKALAVVTGVGPAAHLHSSGSGVVVLEPNEFVVEISGGYSGQYEFELFAIDPLPETASRGLLLNSVIEEYINPPGDVDWYTFDATSENFYALISTSPSSNVAGIVVEIAEDSVGPVFHRRGGPGGRYRNHRPGKRRRPSAARPRIGIQ